MSKNTRLLLIILILLSIVWIFSYVINIPREATFSDLNLEKAVRERIDKPEGPIFTSELQNITAFIAMGLNITDLEGLEYLTNLESLCLSRNNISDVSPLASLTNLRTLVLFKNQIKDISPLASLDNLSRLSLMGNQINDITHLAALDKLHSLVLSENKITDSSTLTSLNKLANLYLRDNQLADISPLVANSGLSEGDRVSLEGNPLSPESINVYIHQLKGRGVEVSWLRSIQLLR